MLKLTLALIVMLVLMTAIPVSAEVSINPPTITKTISGTTNILVRITNTYNTDVNIMIERSSAIDVSVSPTSFTVPSNSHSDVTVTLTPGSYSGSLYYHWSYTLNNTTRSGVIEQPVSVTLRYIIISPKEVSVRIPYNESASAYVTLVNPSDKSVEVYVRGEPPVESISDHHFNLNPYSSKTITLRISRAGEGKVFYEVHYVGATRTIEQDVSAIVYKPEYIRSLENKIKNLNGELVSLNNKVKLPDKIKIKVNNAFVGKTMEIRVTGLIDNKWCDLEKVPVGFEDVIRFTDSAGKVYFSPTKAGLSKLDVYDRFGNIKKERIVNVSKTNITLPTKEVKPGQKIEYNLPENGTLIVYMNGEEIKSSSTGNFTLDGPGKYTVKYNSKSYNGVGTIIVTGKITVSATVNGIELKPGEPVHPGDVIQLGFTYENGMPAKDVDVKIGIPATAFGFSKDTAVLVAMLSDKFEPPFNLVTTKTVDDSTTIVVPEGAEGMITVKAMDTGYASGGELMINVKPVPPNYAMYVIAGLCIASPFIVIINRKFDLTKSRLLAPLTSLLSRRKSYEPPIE